MQDMEVKFVQSEDGTWIAAYSIGNKQGYPMVLSNGLGGNIIAWRHLIDYFKDRFHIISWDYRGLYRSGKPSDPEKYSMQDHVKDLEAVLKYFDVKQAVFLGWSMGVQLNFEFYRYHPQMFTCLIQINGAYGNPMETAFGTNIFAKHTPQIIKFLRFSAPRLQFLVPSITKNGRLVKIMKIIGLLSSTLDESIFQELSFEFLMLDFDIYGRIFKYLCEHDASDVLEKITCPTLLLSGDKDLFTPSKLAIEMASRIPNSELMIIKGGSHYAPVEFPELVNLRIEKFINEHCPT